MNKANSPVYKAIFLACLLAGGLPLSAADPRGMDAPPLKKLTLQQSVDLALEQSLALRQAQAAHAGAKARQDEAATAFGPKLSTSYTYMHLNEEPYFNFPGMAPVIPAARMDAGTQENYTWAFELRQPIFTGGAITEHYRASAMGSAVAGYEKTGRRQDVIEQVTAGYYQVLKALHLEAVARQSLEQLQAHRREVQGLYDVHMVARGDILRAEVELANGKRMLLRARNTVEMAKAQFNTVLRRPINTPVELEDTLNAPVRQAGLDTCLQAADTNRAEIKAATLKVRQSEHLRQAARADYFPTLSAVGHYERFGDSARLDGSDFKDKESWQAGAQASWTIWEWGRTGKRVDALQAQVNQADYGMSLLQDQVRLEVKNAWLNLKDAQEQVEVAKLAITQAEENFRINQERYHEQLSTSTDVLDAQTLLTRAKADYAGALADSHIAQARLERAMGVTEAR